MPQLTQATLQGCDVCLVNSGKSYQDLTERANQTGEGGSYLTGGVRGHCIGLRAGHPCKLARISCACSTDFAKRGYAYNTDNYMHRMHGCECFRLLRARLVLSGTVCYLQ